MSISAAMEMWSPFSVNKISYSRKVFVGGLPIDIDPEVVEKAFGKFGDLYLDWPRMSEIRRERQVGARLASSRNVTGYVFIIYQKEQSVIDLLSQCYCEDHKYYMLLSSPTMHEKPVQVRPWCLSDIDYMPRPSVFLDPRRTIFIGGVPRPTRACELAFVLESQFGPVCYVGVDIDPELKYPKGAARVTFNTTKSFVAAINGRFVNIPHADTTKRVEIKPYVMEDQMCDNCNGKLCADRFAAYFCGDVSCLQYYCEVCWDLVHFNDFSLKKRTSHRPFIRMGDQTRLLPNIPHHSTHLNSLGVSTHSASSAAGMGGVAALLGVRGAAAAALSTATAGGLAAASLAGGTMPPLSPSTAHAAVVAALSPLSSTISLPSGGSGACVNGARGDM